MADFAIANFAIAKFTKQEHLAKSTPVPSLNFQHSISSNKHPRAFMEDIRSTYLLIRTKNDFDF